MNAEERLLYLKKSAEEAVLVRHAVIDQLSKKILDTAAFISGVLGAGGKLLIAGNGGSAAESSHFATEMIVRLTADRNRQSLPAVSLAADTGIITATLNDYGAENIFARQVEGIGNKGDMLVVLSTSGNSVNLLRAATVARERGMMTLGLLGGNGGKLLSLVDHSLVVPHTSTQRIQEEHLFIIHTLVEQVEKDLFA